MGLSLQQGVTRAELRFLQCKAQARPFRERVPDLAGQMPDHQHGGRGFQRVGGTQHVLDEGQPTGRVQNLGNCGLHPRPFPGGENHDMFFGHRRTGTGSAGVEGRVD